MEVISHLASAFAEQHGLDVSSIDWRGWLIFIHPANPNLDPCLMPSKLEHNSDMELRYQYSDLRGISQGGAARRRKLSTTLVRDDTNYGVNLCPSVLLGGGRDQPGGEWTTSSGNPVQAPSDDRFITVAAHGFPRHESPVYHSMAEGKRNGSVSK